MRVNELPVLGIILGDHAGSSPDIHFTTVTADSGRLMYDSVILADNF